MRVGVSVGRHHPWQPRWVRTIGGMERQGSHVRPGRRYVARDQAKGMRPEELGFGRLFEKICDAVVVAAASTQRIVLWNPAAERMFGYSPSEALHLRVEALVPEPLKAPTGRASPPTPRRVADPSSTRTGCSTYLP
jgi:PAS domain-containing protein